MGIGMEFMANYNARWKERLEREVAEAVAAEREACARMAENTFTRDGTVWEDAARQIAAAIRNR